MPAKRFSSSASRRLKKGGKTAEKIRAATSTRHATKTGEGRARRS